LGLAHCREKCRNSDTTGRNVYGHMPIYSIVGDGRDSKEEN